MGTGFVTISEFKVGSLVRDLSKLNIYKHMLLRKKVTQSSVKNFFLMIYFLYFRLSLELGTAMLTRTEAFIVNGLFLLIFLALIDQGTRILFLIVIRMSSVLFEIFWISNNIDKIRKLK